MTNTTTTHLGTILSVWAHPDDETYLAGGLMAAARDAGQRVVCASASAGEHGTDDPTTWPPVRLGQVRRAEAAAAMAVLGVDEHQVLGLPDGRLTDHESSGLAWVRRLIAQVRPDTIVTFGPDGRTFHPDHLAVHRWVTTVWGEWGARCRLLYAANSADHLRQHRRLYEDWGVYMADLRPVGVPADDIAVHLHLSGAELDRKLAALRAMPTQTNDAFEQLDPPSYAGLVAEEAFLDATDLVAVPVLALAS